MVKKGVEQQSIGEILNGVDPETRLPYGVSNYYRNLAVEADPYTDPIAAQYIPRAAENIRLDYESPDPIADDMYTVAARTIHHYHDRVLILVNDRCATYCRHCFRRHFTGSSTGRITSTELADAARYIAETPRVEEVLLSGGDPLMLGDGELRKILTTLKNAPQDGRRLLFRIATRMPVVLPSRITPALAEMLVEATDRRAWLVTHVNHPRELTPEFETGISRLVDAGIPVLNQAVLLRGVNDDASVLEQLFRGLIQMRVKPYYLFQGDLAAGTAHFRTSIDTGLELMDQLRLVLSGMAMPVYAVDLPGGGGKIPLTRDRIEGIENSQYRIRGLDGKLYSYPVEP